MRVTKNTQTETFSIESLTSGQYAYITAVVGRSHALVNHAGRIGGDPVVHDAKTLYAQLIEVAETHELDQLVRAVDTAQELWLERTAAAEQKREAA